jgi:hypothetical protein
MKKYFAIISYTARLDTFFCVLNQASTTTGFAREGKFRHQFFLSK